MQIGAYEKVQDLGEGGMGIVILARHMETGHLYAIKFIKEKLIYHREGLRRFEREKRILQELSRHPFILPLVDSGLHDGVPYYVMPYVDGISLKETIQQIQLSPMECEAIMRNIADALFYAHKRNILHRDIKPGNILIDKQGLAYLTDFGIAVDMIASQEQLTTDLSQMGSVGYTAPEISLGKPATIRTDVYSLGAVIYEMLTGKNFLEAILQSDNHWQALAPPLALVLQKATHTTINERFDNVRDFYYSFSSAVREFYGEGTDAREVPELETHYNLSSSTPIAEEEKRSNHALILVIILLIFVLLTPIYFIINNDIDESILLGDVTVTRNERSNGDTVTVTRNVTATRLPSQTPDVSLTFTATATYTASATVTTTATYTATQISHSPTPAPTEVVSILVVNPQGVNLRSGPGTEFPTTGSADNGRVYTVIARSTDPTEPWYLVRHDGENMWILSTIVQLNGSQNNIPVAATIPPIP